MQHSIGIEAARRLGVVRYAGVVEGKDIIETMHALYRLPEWEYGFDVLWDYSGTSAVILGPDEMTRIVEESLAAENVSGPGVDCIVLSSMENYVMARLYQVLVKGTIRSKRIFGTLAEAEEFLGARRRVANS